jgi:inner membrane transporter RhtA
MCWGFYVVFGAVAAGMAIASVVVVPLGFVESGYALFAPPALAAGLAVATLSSALPLLLDIYTLKRLPRGVFGVLMSAAAAMSAIAGLLVLGETLGGLQWVGIAAITIACAGSGILSARQSRTSITTSLVT